MAEKHSSYSVGYKRPPQHTRFKPGQSGNPRGRSKGTRNLETDLMEELAERIPIREGERSFKVSKQRALLKGLLSKAMKGDTRAAGLVLRLVATVALANEQAAPEQPSDLDPADLAILERFLARQGPARE
jgi:uncharacterized protein DUF5681